MSDTKGMLVIQHSDPRFNLNVHLLLALFSDKIDVVVWNSCDIFDAHDNLKGVIISSKTSFFNSGSRAIQILPPSSDETPVILADSSVQLSQTNYSYLLEKFTEYQSDAIVCTHGIRLFPNITSQNLRFRDGNKLFWRYHNSKTTDRQVHLMILQGGLCIFRNKELRMIIDSYIEHYGPTFDTHWPELFVSIIVNKIIGRAIWKINCDLNYCVDIDVHRKLESDAHVDDFYKHIVDIQWPSWLSSPLGVYNHNDVNKRSRSKSDVWKKGFGGLNVSAESSTLDLLACTYYGASVVRFGAVNDASDLAFLVHDEEHSDWGQMYQHIDANIIRLNESINTAARSGLMVILTFCDVPGRQFRDEEDQRLWKSSNARAKFAAFWKHIALRLANVREFIVGYDLINEPFLYDDVSKSFYCDMASHEKQYLQDLYDVTISEIRKVDKETTIILESPFWASPRSIDMLTPSADANVAYSFHFYCPNMYTNRAKNRGRYKYPGHIPKWQTNKSISDGQFWDKIALAEIISPVDAWQKRHNVKSQMIFVGEFGVCREIPGAETYLTDLTDLWLERGWSWCLFSFRDDEWDAMDYELGTELENQLNREHTNLMNIIAKHLY